MAKISVNPHERRWQRVLLKDMSDIHWSSKLAPTLVADGIVTMNTPSPFWAHLAEELCGRQVLLEHFSRSISRDCFQNALAKLACCAMAHWKRRDRPKSPPILVMMVHQRPQIVLSDSLVASTEVAGIYRSTSASVPFIIIVATELPRDDPRFDSMRLSTRVGDTGSALELAQLLAEQQFTNLDAALELVEDMMRTLENPDERLKKLWAEVSAEAAAINERKMEAMRDEIAKLHAEQAKLHAEQAKKDAEQAKKDAEQAKKDADLVKLNAEIAKLNAEQAKKDAEIERLRRALDEHSE